MRFKIFKPILFHTVAHPVKNVLFILLQLVADTERPVDCISGQVLKENPFIANISSLTSGVTVLTRISIFLK